MASKTSGSRKQTLVSAVVLVALAGIAAGVWVKQNKFVRPADVLGGAIVPDAVSSASVFAYILPETLVGAAEPEFWAPDNLYDKINGKAEDYLSKGFVSLNYQRFHLVGEPDAWLALWVYDMGELANAFAAFSSQRRAEAPSLAMTQHAYVSYGSVYLVHGRFYVEVLVKEDTPRLAAEAHLLAENFVLRTVIKTGGGLAGHALLPEAHRISDSIQLLKADAFGIAGLDNVWTARYDLDGVQTTAFVSRREIADEAGGLAEFYVAILEDVGAAEGAPDGEPPAGMVVRNLDGLTYVIINHGRYLAGVHECPDPGAAYGLGLGLLEHLSESNDE